jgi:hypothetical protein
METRTTLQERANILKERIAKTYRETYKDVPDGEPFGVNESMPHLHEIHIKEGEQPFSRKL